MIESAEEVGLAEGECSTEIEGLRVCDLMSCSLSSPNHIRIAVSPLVILLHWPLKHQRRQ